MKTILTMAMTLALCSSAFAAEHPIFRCDKYTGNAPHGTEYSASIYEGDDGLFTLNVYRCSGIMNWGCLDQSEIDDSFRVSTPDQVSFYSNVAYLKLVQPDNSYLLSADGLNVNFSPDECHRYGGTPRISGSGMRREAITFQEISFQRTLYLGDLGPGGNDLVLIPTEAQKQELDAQAATVCNEYGLSSRRVTNYNIVYGHTNHYTVTALLEADYVCDPQVP